MGPVCQKVNLLIWEFCINLEIFKSLIQFSSYLVYMYNQTIEKQIDIMISVIFHENFYVISTI